MKKIFFYTFIATTIIFSCKETKIVKEEAKPTSTKEEEIINEDKAVITPIMHASAIIQYKDLNLVIDPVENLEAYQAYNSPNIILLTDIHPDHLSVEALQLLVTPQTKLVAPQAVADKIPEFATQLTVLNNGETINIDNIEIEATPMYNLREEALHFHEKGRGNGYLLTINGERIYFSGDTEDIPEMRALKNIDKAFVCMNLPYTMTVESAASAVLEFQPKQVYPYHYRGKPDISDVAKFKELVNQSNKNIEVILLDWYPNDDY